MNVTISKLENWIERIEKNLPKPVFINGTFQYEEVDVKHVAFLKAVRAVSSLHSLPILYEKGLVIDAGTIIRCITDCLNEIFFLFEGYPQITPRAAKFIEHFKSTAYNSAQQNPPTVPSKKIRSALVRLTQKHASSPPDKMQSDLLRVYETFSGYVHSNYSQIMEIYNGHEQKFFTSGIPDPVALNKRNRLVEGVFEKTKITLSFLAMQFEMNEIADEIMNSYEQEPLSVDLGKQLIARPNH